MAAENYKRKLTAILSADVAGYSLLNPKKGGHTMTYLKTVRMSLIAVFLCTYPFLLQTNAIAQPEEEAKYKITLQSRSFTPEAGIDDIFRKSLAKTMDRGEKRHIIIQFTTLPNLAIRERLSRQGIQLLSFIGGNAYFAVVNRSEILYFDTNKAVHDPTLQQIRWIGEIEIGDRVDRQVLEGKFGEWATEKDGAVKVRVVFFQDIDPTTQSKTLALYAEQPKLHSENIWQVTIKSEKIKSLVLEDGVRWIEQEPPPYELLNDITRGEIDVDSVQEFRTADASYDGFSGDGIQVMIRDTGIDSDGNYNDHEDFQNRVLRTNTPTYTHGTHVAGILGGSGFRSNLNDADGNPNWGTAFQWRGMAPYVEFVGYGIGWDQATYITAMTDFGVDISNHSHTQSHTSTYNTDAVTVENIVRNDNLYVVAAAGNNGLRHLYGLLEGYFSIIGTVAKNALSVGSYNSATNLRSDFSSLGPTFDGRIKPDLVAPGHNIRSTVFNDGYGLDSGTSMATPATSGVAALMLEAFWDTYGADTPRPLFSTMKAILIETADDLVQAPILPGEPNCPDFIGANAQPPFFHAGPDWATGYGLINAERAVAAIQTASFYLEGEIEDIGDVDEYQLYVPVGMPELRVTLVWDDYEGDLATPNTTSKLVNDLNLRLIDTNGTVHQPWVLPPLNPASDSNINPNAITAAAPGDDHLNNVEQVQVANPITGIWTVRVYEFSLRQPPQPYSLAANISLHNPRIAISPSESLDFGNVQVGSRNKREIWVSNQGSPDLQINNIRLSGSDLSANLPGSITLHPGQHKKWTIHFSPASGGSKTGRLTFDCNDPERESIEIALTGYGMVQGKKPNGARCTMGNQCQSGHCVGGTCCKYASCRDFGCRATCATGVCRPNCQSSQRCCNWGGDGTCVSRNRPCPEPN